MRGLLHCNWNLRSYANVLFFRQIWWIEENITKFKPGQLHLFVPSNILWGWGPPHVISNFLLVDLGQLYCYLQDRTKEGEAKRHKPGHYSSYLKAKRKGSAHCKLAPSTFHFSKWLLLFWFYEEDLLSVFVWKLVGKSSSHTHSLQNYLVLNLFYFSLTWSNMSELESWGCHLSSL